MLHSYTYQEHELAIAKVAKTLGFKVATSSELQNMAKIVPRSQSAVADAYLSPITDEYTHNFRKGFAGRFADEHANKLFLNQSDGGLTAFHKFTGHRGVLSGPAGGVVGLSKICYHSEDATPVLGFDMGGTSTDVPCRRRPSLSISMERLDYSCAIFSADGGLVANAPHIPGHLGSMSYAIAYQARLYRAGELKPGDVLLSNHPCSGGTHLPDLTVTTPLFDNDDNPKEILFFVANRGHHAGIGGIAPGSMPPNSTELWQEGVAVETFKMVKEGVFDEQGLEYILVDIPASYPGCSGTRTLRDNIADLKAAIASNKRGIQFTKTLVKEYSWPVVQFYIEAIQNNAAHLEAILDYLDDGTPIALKIDINEETGDAVFDFNGTGPEHFGNLNCPPAVMYSGIMYCLRSMISTDILLLPLDSILSPSLKAATVGPNVETSQIIIDLIFRAFQACTASQGTCNNLTFGHGGTDPASGKVMQGFGYYKTIAGGSGAGADWDGESGVHTHVTNTRISDPEILERRYPVILHEFSIRPNSGGNGLHRGGDGCVRDLEFRIPMHVSTG
ncbi:5-oxoprolinase (ATP-hydrolysing) [Venturia nashicola]|nr:5-oxoprolinase (ATP-hydrolysing) [Venturia nashicola]